MSNKTPRELELFIVDVFISIIKIKEYVKSFKNEDDLRHDSLHWDASIRQVEIIGEALNNLLNNDNFNKVAPKYFRKIVNFRNIIIHGYFGVDTTEVWNVIKEKLDILQIDLYSIVKNNIDIETAIYSSIDEYKELNDTLIITFLQNLDTEILR